MEGEDGCGVVSSPSGVDEALGAFSDDVDDGPASCDDIISVEVSALLGSAAFVVSVLSFSISF